jgi:modification methylase
MSRKLGKITLLVGDATKMPMPDKSIDLIVAHPPYFSMEPDRYGGDPKKQMNYVQSRKKYLKLLEKFNQEAARVLKPTGSLWISICQYQHLDFEYPMKTHKEGLLFYIDRIIQNEYDDSDPLFFTQERIVTSNANLWHHFSTGPNLYVNPFKIKKYNRAVWDIPFNNEKHWVDQWMADKYPIVSDAVNIETVKRFIEIYTKEGDLVLDPFGGTGAVAVAAALLGRDCISNDISPDVVEAAKLRLTLTFGEKFVKENVKVVNYDKPKNNKA